MFYKQFHDDKNNGMCKSVHVYARLLAFADSDTENGPHSLPITHAIRKLRNSGSNLRDGERCAVGSVFDGAFNRICAWRIGFITGFAPALSVDVRDAGDYDCESDE